MASLRRRVYIATGVSYKNYRAVRPLLVAPARPESLQEVMLSTGEQHSKQECGVF